jgi:hypothetical protein
VRARFLTFIVVFQSVQFLAHFFLYETWISFWGAMDPPALLWLRVITAVLSISFVTASLLAFRFDNVFVRSFYRPAAVWLGTLVYFFMASIGCWILYPLALAAGVEDARRQLIRALFGIAVAAALYAVVNASTTRVHRVRVKLENLPESWRGRTAALVSDTHLGAVRNQGFVRRVVALINNQEPDVVFIAGDVFDGTQVDAERIAEPWSQLAAPFGSYFVGGNHEEFTGRDKFFTALARHGIRVLNNEKIEVDGLQLLGVHFWEASYPERFRTILQSMAISRERAAVLLLHAPDHLEIPAQEGISLQLSGHTHGGQFFPFTLLVRRIYGQYAHGLQRFGDMNVFVTWGAGTWGPPLRLGTQSEIVIIEFE